MKEKASVGEQPTIFLPKENSYGWEEDIKSSPKRRRYFGGAVISLLVTSRTYEIADAAATLTHGFTRLIQ